MTSIGSAAACLVLALLGTTLPAQAHEQRAGDIVLSHAWAPATPGGARSAAGYVLIENTGGEPERLLGIASRIAEVAELHQMSMENDVMKMAPTGVLEIPAGGSVKLKPHGLHVMLMGLRVPLAEGDTFILTMTFERAGSIDLQVVVQSAGSTEPAD